jgi:transglutaminase-like putative cysteine protease
MTVNYQLMGTLSGNAGIRQTLRRMAAIARGYKTAPLVRETALKVLGRVPEKNWRAECAALLAYVQEHVKYVRDVLGVETLQTPVQTLRLRRGDCDDQSMLLAALLMSVGHPARFVAVGSETNTFCHVLVQTKIGADWVWCEPINRGWPMGKAPFKFKSMMIENI